MDVLESPEISLAKQRLSSFSRSPNLNNTAVPLSNSPIKLTEAGFERVENTDSDEVFCKFCGLTYRNWEGESPLAVHRILRPHCPFLNPQSESHSNNASRIHTSTRELLFSSSFSETIQLIKAFSTRRQLFSNDESHENNLLLEQPFRPKHASGFLMLFESHRLLTFQKGNYSLFSLEAATYAKCGFVLTSDSSKAMCVFCNFEIEIMIGCTELDIEMQHKNPECPFVRGYDVGNISRECECTIRDKVRYNNFCSSFSTRAGSENNNFKIRYPEYEELNKRMGTFKLLPMLLRDALPVKEMVECGFFYTGLMDCARCFCCGVGLRSWSKGADPFTQHSRASQHCLFVLQAKGQDFIDISQHVELVVEADYGDMAIPVCGPEHDASSTPSSTFSSPPSSQVGSPTLDMAAIKAATCQYTIEQIADAVIKFFFSSWGQYPNEELLIGTLRAADENHKQICQQREEIINKESQLHDKDSQLQAKDSQLQSVIQAKDRELAVTRQSLQHRVREDFEQLLEQKDEQLEQKDEQLEQNREQLEQKDEQLEQKDGIIEQKDDQLKHQNVELYFKNRELEDLKRHIQSLRQELRRKEASSMSSGAIVWDLPITSGNEEEFPVARCTVCLSNPSQIVFQPCGHLCCCDQCASKLFGKKCPICRETNVALDKVYVI